VALLAGGLASLGAQDLRSYDVQWRRAGDYRYRYLTSGSPVTSGGATVALWSVSSTLSEPGMIRATLPAAPFRGRAVRIRGELRTREAAQGASLWVRIEGQGGAVLTADYGVDLRIRGSSEWEDQELVLPVPAGAEAIAFGLLLEGEGRLDARRVRVDVVEQPRSGATATRPARLQRDTASAESPSLDAIRDALADGDTAWAVAQLTPRESVTVELDSRTLTDLLLLLWIGATPGHRGARAPWREVQRMLLRPADPYRRTDAARVLRAAAHLEQGQAPQLFQEFGVAAEWWRDRLAGIAERSAGSDSLLVGAIRWVFALDDMRQIKNLLKESMPYTTELPPECRTRSLQSACWLRTPPPSAGRLRTLLDQDSAGRLPLLRADLDTARSTMWPFNAESARMRVALAAMLDDHDALAAFAEDTAGLAPRVAGAVRVIAFAFGGQRARAAREMTAHAEWYAGLDAELTELGAGRMAPELFWRLAWPLLLQPYNERQVAHRARLLLADVLQHGVGDTAGAFDAFYDRATLVRRGIPRGLLLVRSPWGIGQTRTTVVSYISPSMHETLVRLGLGAMPASLDLALAARDRDALATYSGYVAEDYDSLTPFEHQVVQYRRDGHRMVDVHAAPPVIPTCDHPDRNVGFFLLDNRLQILREVMDTAPRRRRYRFRMELAPAVYVYSLELLDTTCRLAARARYVLTVPPPDSTRLSDLVLAERVALENPGRVRGDPPIQARPGLRVSAGESVEFYWEAYDLHAAEQQPERLEMQFEMVRLSQDRVGLQDLQRLESVLERTKPLLSLGYRATVPPGTEPLGFGLSVTIPEEASGLYVARVTVRDPQTGWEETARRALYVESQDE
jgi:hypothetical protein